MIWYESLSNENFIGILAPFKLSVTKYSATIETCLKLIFSVELTYYITQISHSNNCFHQTSWKMKKTKFSEARLLTNLKWQIGKPVYWKSANSLKCL